MAFERDPAALVTSVASYLAVSGVGSFTTGPSSIGNLFRHQAPTTPTNLTVVAHTGGFSTLGSPTRLPTFTIQVRDTNVNSGMYRAKEINKLLDDQWNVLTGYPGRVSADSEPGASFRDENGHYVFPMNYVVYTTYQG